MNTQYESNWYQFWRHLFAIADLDDHKKIIILRICLKELPPLAIPLPFEFPEVHVVSLWPGKRPFHPKTRWFKPFRSDTWEQELPIKNRKMDRIIVFADEFQSMAATPYLFSEIRRILVPGGRLVMGVQYAPDSPVGSQNPKQHIARELEQYHFTNIIVGNYPAEILSRQANGTSLPEGAIIATGTNQHRVRASLAISRSNRKDMIGVNAGSG